MLSYRHSYHAGNHADVLKHTVQSLIIESLKEKEKPFLYLDTHAGAGRYQLSSEHAERTGEYLEGIARIWQQDDLPQFTADRHRLPVGPVSAAPPGVFPSRLALKSSTLNPIVQINMHSAGYALHSLFSTGPR